MQNIRGIGLGIVLLLGCNPPERTIGLFVNPSRTFDLQKIHLLASSGNNVILDTVIQNNHIDKSLLLKRFNAGLIKDNTLLIEIGSKYKSVKIPDINQGCVDIFTFYDDHTVVNGKALEIKNKKNENGIIADHKQIVDSLKKSKIGIYDKIEIDIKPRDCL